MVTKKKKILTIVVFSSFFIILLFGVYFVYENFFRTTLVYGLPGKAGDVTEEALKQQMKTECDALDEYGVPYNLVYVEFDPAFPEESVLWITVAEKDTDWALDTISYVLYGEPDAKIDGKPARGGPANN